jgi:hypothetical protein
MAVDPKLISEAAADVARAEGRKARAARLAAWSATTGLSVAHLRRHMKAAGALSGYAKTRSDAGVRKSNERAEAAYEVSQIVLATEGTMPVWVAIQHGRRLGLVPEGMDLQPHYVNRFMLENGLAREAPKGPRNSRKCDWGEPGECLQVDSTNCAQWFFTEETGEIRFTRTGEVYRNKENKSPPIMRYVATDPVTACFRVRYYQTAGESAEVTLDFLYWAMSRATRPERMPMAGIPQVLVVDGGSGNKSSAVKNLCAELNIDHRSHLPGHSWAKGSVEGTMMIWQEVFESELRLWPARSLEELNARAEAANEMFCAERKLTRSGLPRSALYAAAVKSVTLPPPWELFVEAARSTPVERTVGDGLTISHEGLRYYVGGLAGCGIGDKCLVSRAVLDWSEEAKPLRVAFGDQVIIEKALARDERGNFIDRRLYEKRHDAAIDGAEAVGQERLQRLQAMPAPTVEAPVASTTFHVPEARPPQIRLIAGPSYRRTPALLRLVERLGRDLSKLEVASLNWGDTVPASEIEAASARLDTRNKNPEEKRGGAAAG